LRGCAHCGVEGVINVSVAILALYCENTGSSVTADGDVKGIEDPIMVARSA